MRFAPCSKCSSELIRNICGACDGGVDDNRLGVCTNCGVGSSGCAYVVSVDDGKIGEPSGCSM